MATKKTRMGRAVDAADEVIEVQKEAILEAIEKIERQMRPYEELNERKQKLQRSLNALSGGNTLTGAGTNRLNRMQIAEFLEENPGSTPATIAEHFGVQSPTVGSHLYRNKDMFINKDGKYWRRNPAEGLNTADDIDDE